MATCQNINVSLTNTGGLIVSNNYLPGV